jgi:5-(carboxyamino)imidazole ribonucleotide mutase
MPPCGSGRFPLSAALSFRWVVADVAIIMGSQSDWETMRHAAETLKALGVSHEARIISAHRTPDRMFDFAKGAKAEGFR